jgi:acetyl esterase/lipase
MKVIFTEEKMDIKLWDSGTPLFDEKKGQPEPTLTPYLLPDYGKKTGCVIVLPGGGYAVRADHEGMPISKMYNEAGINSFVLNYRVSPYRYPAPLYDVQRAVRLVRARADEFNIDPEKIAVLGFSAGGHLAAMAVTQYDKGLDEGDDIDKVSCRPNAGILCYAVISLGEYTHQGSRDNLLGNPADPALVKKLSGEEAVRDDNPPLFMWHTAEDAAVPVENSLNMALALRKKQIPFELHIFPYGHHGLGLAPQHPEVARWAELSVRWLKAMGY